MESEAMRQAVEVVALSRSDAEYMQQHLQQGPAPEAGVKVRSRAVHPGISCNRDERLH